MIIKLSSIKMALLLMMTLLGACAEKEMVSSELSAPVVEESVEIDQTSNESDETVEEISYGPTDLHVAAHQGQIDRVKAILETEPDPDIRDSFGGTALHAAMFQDNIEIVELLVNYGLDVDAKGTGNGYTPLHDAVWASNLEAAKVLVENGADVSLKNNEGQTPLDKAISEGKTEIVTFLESIK